jgi:hypothetical protein
MKIYKIARAGNVIGEYDESTVARFLLDGTIRADDFGWTSGMSDWKKLSDLGFAVVPPPLPNPAYFPARPVPHSPVPQKRSFAYSAWMLAAFFAPYLFSWRIIFDKTLGYSKGWKIFYALWIPIVLAIVSGGGTTSSSQPVSQESKNAAFMARLTPEQRIAVETMQRNIRLALRENFDYQDNNKDGRLDLKEFLSQGILKNTYVDADFVRLDANKDGYVTFEEMMQK